MSDNVTAFPGRADLPENPLQLDPQRPGYCDHATIILNEHDRTVRCADPKCGATLDAFDVLRSNARHLQRAWSAHRDVMRQANEVAERVSTLKREEQNLRARVKRLQTNTGAIVHTRGDKT